MTNTNLYDDLASDLEHSFDQAVSMLSGEGTDDLLLDLEKLADEIDRAQQVLSDARQQPQGTRPHDEPSLVEQEDHLAWVRTGQRGLVAIVKLMALQDEYNAVRLSGLPDEIREPFMEQYGLDLEAAYHRFEEQWRLLTQDCDELVPLEGWYSAAYVRRKRKRHELGDRRRNAVDGNKYPLGWPGNWERFAAAMRVARGICELHWEALWMGNLGTAALQFGDFAEAQIRFESALDYLRGVADYRHQGWYLACLAEIAAKLGNHLEAGTRLEEALTLLRRSGNSLLGRMCAVWLSDIATHLADHPELRTRLEVALSIAGGADDHHS